MQTINFSRAGATNNEDEIALTNSYGFVLDGATGLLKENITNLPSDAQWFVQQWKYFLQQNLQNNSTPLKQILKQGVQR